MHGVHEHAVEHQAHGGDSFAGRIAVMTAILSTVGALFSFQGGNEQNLALLEKNEAAIKQAQASDQWAYYQSKGNKQNLAELGAALVHRRCAGRVSRRTLRTTRRRKADDRAQGTGARGTHRHGGVGNAATRRCMSITAGRRR